MPPVRQETADPLIGALVRLNVHGATYTGIVQRIDRLGNPYVSIRLCSDGGSTNLSRPGKTMDFYGEELDNLELLVPEKDVPAGLRKPAAPRTMTLPPVTPPITRAPASTSQEDREWNECRASTFDQSHRQVSKAEWIQRLKEEPARPIRPAANSHRPSPMDADYTHVVELGERFKSVILTLAESPTVGMTAFGKNISRHGEVSLLAMSCRKGDFLFDLHEIGVKEAMDAGIQEVLESPHVLKVTHDCRHLSDYFFHKLDIKILNIFDTQAADWMIRRAEAGGMVPIHVNSLRFCLQRYLQLFIHEVRFHDTIKDAVQEDADVWLTRPLQSYLLDSACRAVHYLPELHGVMLEALLSEFIHAVDIYMGAVRDLTDDDSATENGDVLPQLRREFAINAGTRNFAAPGRATSPERDGLHHVPRSDANPVHDREVLNSFFTSHRNRYGDVPESQPSQADAGSFPLRSTGSRVTTSSFSGFDQDPSDPEEEDHRHEECLPAESRISDSRRMSDRPASSPAVQVNHDAGKAVNGVEDTSIGTSVDAIDARNSRSERVSQTALAQNGLPCKTPCETGVRHLAHPAEGSSVDPTDGHHPEPASRPPWKPRESEGRLPGEIGAHSGAVSAIGSSVDTVDVQQHVHVEPRTPKYSTDEVQQHVHVEPRTPKYSTDEVQQHVHVEPRTPKYKYSTSSTSEWHSPPYSSSRQEGISARRVPVSTSSDPKHVDRSESEPRSGAVSEQRHPPVSRPEETGARYATGVPSALPKGKSKRPSHPPQSTLPQGVLPLSAVTSQPKPMDDLPATGWRPNPAALEASWKNFTGREETNPRAVIMGIGTGDSGQGSYDSTPSSSPEMERTEVSEQPCRVPPFPDPALRVGRGSGVRFSPSHTATNAPSSSTGNSNPGGRGCGRGQFLAAVGSGNWPGR
eukprot:scpid25244/ scgid1665/ Exonuclease 3&apos; Exonuclease 3&apos